MIRPLVHDAFFLMQKSQPATAADTQAVGDLSETLRAHRHECVGMAANMIGVRKNIIVFDAGFGQTVMLNAVITAKEQPYETEEGCLSYLGSPKKVLRYQTITVEYQDRYLIKKKGTFTGLAAQIIQHELDHVAGILI